MRLKEQVAHFLKTSKPEIMSRSSKYNELLNEVISSTSFLKNATIAQRLWHILNDYLEPFKCIGGHIGVSFISLKKGYRSCCKESKCDCWNHKKEILSKEMKRKNDNNVMSDSLFKSYGVLHPFQSDMIKEKAKKTVLQKYGVENSFQSKIIKEKIKNTLIDRFDETHPMRSCKIKLKWKSTLLNRYGVLHPFCFQSSKEKAQKTIIEKYGVNNFSHYHLKDILPKIQSQEWWNERSCFLEARELIGDFLSNSNLYLYAHRFRPDWDFRSSISQPHQIILNLLNKYQIKYEINSRQVIGPQELDIFIPSKSLAIEVNGVYWHSELAGGKDRNYHLNKTMACEKQGIQLLQFWDIEIKNQWDIVSSIILSKLEIYNTIIDAEKCCLIKPTSEQEKQFLNENHLQGFISSNICLGLNHQNELVSILSFGKQKSNSANYKLLRFCNRMNVKVIGGTNKLFDHRPKGSLISYANRRYSNENLYVHSGFTKQSIMAPNYFYTKDYQTLESRMKYQKHKLPGILENFDPSLTEWQNMANHGFDRIWDCGSQVWII